MPQLETICRVALGEHEVMVPLEAWEKVASVVFDQEEGRGWGRGLKIESMLSAQESVQIFLKEL